MRDEQSTFPWNCPMLREWGHQNPSLFWFCEIPSALSAGVPGAVLIPIEFSDPAALDAATPAI